MLNRRNCLSMIGAGIASAVVTTGSAIALADADLTTPSSRSAVEKGLDYLAKRQNDDGAFGAGGYARNVGVVGLIATAFLSHGDSPDRGRRGRVVSSCLKYVLKHAKENGFINAADFAGYGPMYG